MQTDLRAALREHFGHEAFRPGQEDAVRAALAGRDVLVVMPTGAGKSLCYQLPALVRDDLTVVVSPLVSLMEDQLAALDRIAPGRAALVSGQRDAAANADAIARAARGDLRLLYVAPERFATPGFTERLAAARVGLFVVDEAHCVSQWGHDFRPEYFRLADAARALGARSVIASTATATPPVATDVARRLGLRDPVRVTTGFDRPNVAFAVVPCATGTDRARRIVRSLADPAARPAIVYTGTRDGAERLAARLGDDLGVSVAAYHAGLPRTRRAAVQRRFMAGEHEVVVATNAFGMGIDKPDVRTVAHDGVPASLEGYYQEAGRAGRDGAPARALLFTCAKDKGLHVHFIQRGEVGEEPLDAVAGGLAAAAIGGVADVPVAALGDDADRVRTAVGHLAQSGFLTPSPAAPDRVRAALAGGWTAQARTAALATCREAEAARWRAYRAVWAYAEGPGCRRVALLRHFGDRVAPGARGACCDRCDPVLVPPALRVARGGSERGAAAVVAGLDDAILSVVGRLGPAGAGAGVGVARVAAILRGGRAWALARRNDDGLPEYGTFTGLDGRAVGAAIDALVASGRLEATGGLAPKLRLPSQVQRAA